MSSGEVQQIYEMLLRIDELLSVIEGKTQSLEGSLPQVAEAVKVEGDVGLGVPAAEAVSQDVITGSQDAVTGDAPLADAGGEGFSQFYSMRQMHRALMSMDRLLSAIQKTQGEQGKQILELAGKVSDAGSQIFMLQIMGKRFASALENKNYLGAAMPVLGAVASGIGVGVNAAAETQASMELVKEGKTVFGRDVDRQSWAQEQWMIAMRHSLTLGLL